ncbi:putative DNA-binding protein [Agrilactobacillus fermenti]|uniref:putative DNA-binding protein n=1 Tax=Agrilactobacillus fermenti TaxID=2586909 RepID=UPI001E2950C8|nr:putative DNA-binding protein [Agrilactobacillus fermenti]MCD2256236.1 putative DNA-binding protein [Agrilactobacillus fermenti]
MELEKNNRINELFDFYGMLLTQKQHEYIRLYYRDDYSLGEIATHFAVSRQAVYDNIHRTEQILNNYEQKLHLYQRYQNENHLLQQMRQHVATHYPTDQKLVELIMQIEAETDA